MYEQAIGSPASGSGYDPGFPPPRPVLAYELRPLSTGEVLDRTFALYRQRFWLYCSLSAIAAAIASLSALVQILVMPSSPKTGAAGANPDPMVALKAGGVVVAVSLVASLIHLVAYSLVQAATVSAVSSVYLGHETSMQIAFKAVLGKWWRYSLIALWQAWSALWIFTLLLVPAFVLIAMRVPALVAVGGFLVLLSLGSLIYGVIAYLRNALAIAASVFERLPVRPSMRRSKVLSAGLKGRLFLLLVLLLALGLTAGGLQLPFVLMLTHSHAGQKILLQGGSLILGFITNTLIGPIGAIGFCLFYFDARVRKEGFDIEALMDRTLGSPLSAPVALAPLLPTGFAPSGFTAETPVVSPPPSPLAPSQFVAPSPIAPPFPPSGFADPEAARPLPPRGSTHDEPS